MDNIELIEVPAEGLAKMFLAATMMTMLLSSVDLSKEQGQLLEKISELMHEATEELREYKSR